MSFPVHFSSEVAFHGMMEDLAQYGEEGHESLQIQHTAQGDKLVTAQKEGIWKRIWNFFTGADEKVAKLAVELFTKNKQYIVVDKTFEQAYERIHRFTAAQYMSCPLSICKGDIRKQHDERIDAKIKQLSSFIQSSKEPQDKSSVLNQGFNKALENSKVPLPNGTFIDLARLREEDFSDKAITNFTEYLRDSASLYSLTNDDVENLLKIAKRVGYDALEFACAEVLGKYEKDVNVIAKDPEGNEITIPVSSYLFKIFTNGKFPHEGIVFNTYPLRFVQAFVNYIENKGVPLNMLSDEILINLAPLADDFSCSSLQEALKDNLGQRMTDYVAVELLKKKLDPKSTIIQLAIQHVTRQKYSYSTFAPLAKQLDRIPRENLEEVMRSLIKNNYIIVNYCLILFKNWFENKGIQLSAPNPTSSHAKIKAYAYKKNFFIKDLQKVAEKYPSIVKILISSERFNNYFYEKLNERHDQGKAFKITPEQMDEIKFLLKNGANPNFTYILGLCMCDQGLVDLAKQYGAKTSVDSTESFEPYDELMRMGGRLTRDEWKIHILFLLKNKVFPVGNTRNLHIYTMVLDMGDENLLEMLVKENPNVDSVLKSEYFHNGLHKKTLEDAVKKYNPLPPSYEESEQQEKLKSLQASRDLPPYPPPYDSKG
ncbi:MAG: hypothetical protein P4L16_06710 [Chlamydiales bacterium]|nr:hypothetical protein [Chlamydiales bacterium]